MFGTFNVSKNRTRLIKGAVPLPIRPAVENDYSPDDEPYYTVEDEDKENLPDNVPEVRLFKKPRIDSPASVLSITSGNGSSSTVTCSETEIEERKLSFQTRKSGIKAPKAKLLINKLKNANNMIVYQKTTIRKLKKENYLLRGRLQSLNATFSYLKSHSFLSTSAEKIIDATLPTSAGVLLKRASKGILKNKSNKLSREKYAPEIRSFALTLSFYSMKSYNYVQEKFNNTLPHPATLSKWYQSVDGSPGFSEQAIVIIKRRVMEFTDQKKEVLCNLLMDEMAIMKRVEWNGKKFTGFVDLGSNNSLIKDNSEAKNALVFMLVAINDHWKIPVGYFLIDGLTGMERASLTRKLLSFLHVTGVKVTSITFDGAQSNFNMVKCLGADFQDPTALKTSFEHPETKEPVYIFLDPPHMLKLWRNCLAHVCTLTDSNENFVEWRYFQTLVELQNEEGLHAGTKLEIDTLNLKMKSRKLRLLHRRSAIVSQMPSTF